MRMAEIPGQGALGQEAVPIPAAEEALLLEDRQQEQRQEALEAVQERMQREIRLRARHRREALPLEAQDAVLEVEELPLPDMTVIIMKQDDLLLEDAGEEEEDLVRISQRL